MNFFEHQAQARRQSLQLIWFFFLAVLCIVVGINFVFHVLAVFFIQANELHSYQFFRWLPRPFYAYCTLATLVTIGTGTYIRLSQLKEGGSAVARLMGAEPVARNTQDVHEQRLLNVVEEMAIASGIRIPRLYIMQRELGINAFAAGYSPNEAAIAVTKGTLDVLNREELQGVIAHEFSHILNGDMRMNIRLMGILHGILMIGILGGYLLRNDIRGHNPLQSIVVKMFGLALYSIGYTGVFFGRLIKAAISRQREFLADASAVQFTRNPDGLAQALKKIHDHVNGSRMQNRHSEELSHMLFSDGLKHLSVSEMFATHPPLRERVRRIRPGLAIITYKKGKEPLPHVEEHGLLSFHQNETHIKNDTQTILNSIGAIDDNHLCHAQTLLQAIPTSLLELLTKTNGAKAVLLSLLLSEQENEATKTLLKNEFPELTDTLLQIHQVRTLLLSDEHRIPLIDLSLNSLRDLPQTEKNQFLAQLKNVIDSDQQTTFFEFVLFTILSRQLSPKVGRAPSKTVKHIPQVAGQCHLILSMMANVGQIPHQERGRAVDKGMLILGLAPQTILNEADISLDKVKKALDDLRKLAVIPQMKLIKALLETALHDTQLHSKEAEFLRAVAESLDCPIPPILFSPNQPA
ncbi:MAG TPA: M48 family metallopeptidase [Pseudomonadales bacterium]|nr:M48 family metallopeptidase [Pseudomonadales bacterium]